MNEPIVSICLPCYGRVEYVRKTLESLYEDNGNVSLEDYEIVISDNDPNQAIRKLVSEFNYPNIHYHYTRCEGFMNSYYVLTYANGKFLKLHNSQVTFRNGALSRLIEEVKENLADKPLMFYTNGFLYRNRSDAFSSFNDFFYALSYWPSWSNGFSIWKDDFNKLGAVSLNRLFPHTSLFITQHGKRAYIVNDHYWFDTQRVKGRSGHNKFEAFTIEFPSLVDECHKNGWIREATKKRVMKDVLTEFLPVLLFNKYVARIEHFDISGYRQNIKQYFPMGAFYISILYMVAVPFRIACRKLNGRFNRDKSLNNNSNSRGVLL